MDTLSTRIDWILANRMDPATGAPWEAKALSVAADLAPAHVGMIRRGQVKRPAADTLVAIARVAPVSYRWLATGEGMPDDDDDATPGGDEARVIPRMENLPDASLESTMMTLDPTIPAWVRRRMRRAEPLIEGHLTAGALLDLAHYLMKHEVPPAGEEPSRRRSSLKGR